MVPQTAVTVLLASLLLIVGLLPLGNWGMRPDISINNNMTNQQLKTPTGLKASMWDPSKGIRVQNVQQHQENLQWSVEIINKNVADDYPNKTFSGHEYKIRVKVRATVPSDSTGTLRILVGYMLPDPPPHRYVCPLTYQIWETTLEGGMHEVTREIESQTPVVYRDSFCSLIIVVRLLSPKEEIVAIDHWGFELSIFPVERAVDVKFKGRIVEKIFVWGVIPYRFSVTIDEVLSDPTGRLQKGNMVWVLPDNAFNVNDIVEVYGDYHPNEHPFVYVWKDYHYVREHHVGEYDVFVMWGTEYDDYCSAVAIDSQGNVYVVGKTDIEDPYDAFHFLAKFDKDGRLLWDRVWYGYWGGISSTISIAVGPDDKVYVTGHDSRGSVYLMVFNNDGSLLESLRMEGAEYMNVHVDKDGNAYLVAGKWWKLPIYVLKIGPDFKLKWSKAISADGFDIEVDPKHGDVILSSVASTIKLYSNGGWGWGNIIIDPEIGKPDGEETDSVVDSNGNVYRIWHLWRGPLLIKFSPSGDLLWSLDLGDILPDSLTVDEEGNVIVLGYKRIRNERGLTGPVALAIITFNQNGELVSYMEGALTSGSLKYNTYHGPDTLVYRDGLIAGCYTASGGRITSLTSAQKTFSKTQINTKPIQRPEIRDVQVNFEERTPSLYAGKGRADGPVGGVDVGLFIIRKSMSSHVLLIGELIKHDVTTNSTEVKVLDIWNCTNISPKNLKEFGYNDYDPNAYYIEIKEKKCTWEMTAINNKIVINWKDAPNFAGRDLMKNANEGDIIEFLGKLEKNGDKYFGHLVGGHPTIAFMVPRVFLKLYIKSIILKGDFDQKNGDAADIYFKVNIIGVDDDLDQNIDEEGEYVRLPYPHGDLGGRLHDNEPEIRVTDDDLRNNKEITGPMIHSSKPDVIFPVIFPMPVPVTLRLQIWDEDTLWWDDLVADFKIVLTKDELKQNRFRICKWQETDKIKLQLCAEPVFLTKTKRFHGKSNSVDLELNYYDINGLEAYTQFIGQRYEEVKVAIVEFGLPDKQPEWEKRVESSWECDDNSCVQSSFPLGFPGERGHASMVAGIVASEINGRGAAGLGWNAKLILISISIQRGASLASAIKHAVDLGAKVISLSIMVFPAFGIEEAIKYAVKNGVVIVAAAGNDASSRVINPQVQKPVIKVAGITRYAYVPALNNALYYNAFGLFLFNAYYSNYGKYPQFDPDMVLRVDFSTLSTIFITTSINGGYRLGTGTSAAAPVLASVVALIQGYAKAKHGRYLTINEVYEVLRQASIDLGDPGWDPYYGWGMVDVKRAIEIVLSGIPTPTIDITGLPPPKSGTMVTMASSGSQLLLNILDKHGKTLFGFDKKEGEIIAEYGVEHIVTPNYTQVFLPITRGEIEILVDAEYAHQDLESLNITITTIINNTLVSQKQVNNTISKGDILGYNVKLTEEGDINVREELVGDINDDGSVDHLDLALLARHYGSKVGETNYLIAADLNRDGSIDHVDLAILAKSYGRRYED